MTVEGKIRAYLRNEHITQAFISKRTGIPEVKLSKSLNDNRRLTFQEYELICGALGVPVDKFLEPRHPPKQAS